MEVTVMTEKYCSLGIAGQQACGLAAQAVMPDNSTNIIAVMNKSAPFIRRETGVG
jgi:hypothetical protein